MSRTSISAGLAVEWSPSAVRSFIPGQGESQGIPSGWQGVRVGLSRRNTFVRAIRIPNVSAAEASQIIRIQAPKHFPLSPEELVFSFRLTNDVNAEGRLAIISAARASVVRSLFEDLKARDVSAAEVVPAAYGSMLLARAMGLADATVVESGPEGWSIDLVASGELRHSRVLPPETDSSALGAEIERTFEMAGLSPLPVVAAGNAKVLGAAHTSDRSSLSMLVGSDAGALNVGLALPEVLAAKVKQQVSNRARLAVLLSVAAVALGAVVGLDRLDAAEAIRRDEVQNQQGLRKLKQARDAAQAQLSSVGKVANTLARAFEPAQKASEVIAQITSLAPSSIWLTGITFERGKPVLLRGIALQSGDVATFLDKLSSQDRFREVKLAFANNAVIEETNVSQFSISLHAIGNLPLADPKANRRTAAR